MADVDVKINKEILKKAIEDKEIAEKFTNAIDELFMTIYVDTSEIEILNHTYRSSVKDIYDLLYNKGKEVSEFLQDMLSEELENLKLKVEFKEGGIEKVKEIIKAKENFGDNIKVKVYILHRGDIFIDIRTKRNVFIQDFSNIGVVKLESSLEEKIKLYLMIEKIIDAIRTRFVF